MVYDDLTHLKPLATKLWNEARNEAFILNQRDEAKRQVYEQLYAALSLPFDQALPIVKKFINVDFRLIYDDRIVNWCTVNSKAIAADHAANPKGK